MFLIGEGSGFIHEKPCMALTWLSKSMHGWGHLNMNNFNRTLMETFSHTPPIYVSTCCLECMVFCWRFLGGFKLKSSSMTWMSRGIRRSLHQSFAPASSKWPENSLPFNGGHLLNFTPEEVTPTPPNFVSLGRIWWALDKNLWSLALDVRSRNGTSSPAASVVVAPRLKAHESTKSGVWVEALFFSPMYRTAVGEPNLPVTNRMLHLASSSLKCFPNIFFLETYLD